MLVGVGNVLLLHRNGSASCLLAMQQFVEGKAFGVEVCIVHLIQRRCR